MDKALEHDACRDGGRDAVELECRVHFRDVEGEVDLVAIGKLRQGFGGDLAGVAFLHVPSRALLHAEGLQAIVIPGVVESPEARSAPRARD